MLPLSSIMKAVHLGSGPVRLGEWQTRRKRTLVNDGIWTSRLFCPIAVGLDLDGELKRWLSESAVVGDGAGSAGRVLV